MSAKFFEPDQNNTASPQLNLSAYSQRFSRAQTDPTGDFTKARSFLRWVGGKQFLLPDLERFLPSGVRKLTYFEPFAGAANFFFALQPARARISDLNTHLIDCYRAVAENPAQVAAYLREHKLNDSEAYYYGIRTKYNDAKPSAAQAARFIYLNRTCFNGIFRVNTKGQFNVPYGHKPTPVIPTALDLEFASRILKRATLESVDFDKSLSRVGKGCFAYVDPPYPPLNGTAFFTHYTAGRFSGDNQARLASALHDVDKRGGLFMLTNAELPAIKELYKKFYMTTLSVRRSVSSNGSRERVGELVITNYRSEK